MQACGGHDAGGDLKRHDTAQHGTCQLLPTVQTTGVQQLFWVVLVVSSCLKNALGTLPFWTLLHLFPFNQQSSVKPAELCPQVPVKHQKSKTTHFKIQCVLAH